MRTFGLSCEVIVTDDYVTFRVRGKMVQWQESGLFSLQTAALQSAPAQKTRHFYFKRHFEV